MLILSSLSFSSFFSADIREYAVLALRNILEDNVENQELIAEMKPLEAVQTDELAEMGLRPRLIDGKVKLERDFRTP